MEEDGALIAVAEVAVAIAGFSGIAAALRHGTADAWPIADRNRLIDLLAHSGIALFASLIPLVSAHRTALGPDLWSRSSLIWAVCATLGMSLSLLRDRGRSLRDLPRVLTLLVFAAVTLLQLHNWLSLGEFWPYLAALVANLGFAFIQFMTLAIPKSAT